MELQPTYKHDCDKCEFVAPACVTGKIVDVWKNCNSFQGASQYIIRYSSEPSDYSTVYATGDADAQDPRSHYAQYKGNPAGFVITADYIFCKKLDEMVNGVSESSKRKNVLAEA